MLIDAYKVIVDLPKQFYIINEGPKPKIKNKKISYDIFII